MKYTTNLNLKKPDYTDLADIADVNSNMDTIDLEFGKRVMKEDSTLTTTNKTVIGAINELKDGKVNTSEKGQANGIVGLENDGLINKKYLNVFDIIYPPKETTNNITFVSKIEITNLDFTKYNKIIFCGQYISSSSYPAILKIDNVEFVRKSISETKYFRLTLYKNGFYELSTGATMSDLYDMDYFLFDKKESVVNVFTKENTTLYFGTGSNYQSGISNFVIKGVA